MAQTAPELAAVLREASQGEVQPLSEAGQARQVGQVNARLSDTDI